MRINIDTDDPRVNKQISVVVENNNGEVLAILRKVEQLPTKSWEHPAGFMVPAGWGAQTPGCEGVWVEIDDIPPAE